MKSMISGRQSSEDFIIDSVSSEIQLSILRKETVINKWIILEQMYETKKKNICVSTYEGCIFFSSA